MTTTRDGGIVLAGGGGSLLVGHESRLIKLDETGRADACTFVGDATVTDADAPLTATPLSFTSEPLDLIPIVRAPTSMAAVGDFLLECN